MMALLRKWDLFATLTVSGVIREGREREREREEGRKYKFKI
jgi:hypothetical protein